MCVRAQQACHGTRIFFKALSPLDRSPQPLVPLEQLLLSIPRTKVLSSHAKCITLSSPNLKLILNTVYLCSAFYNIVSRCFTESETQSRNPQVSTVARESSLLTGRNLEQDPAYREEPSC